MGAKEKKAALTWLGMMTWCMISPWSCTWIHTSELSIFMLTFSLTALILWLGRNTALCMRVCLSFAVFNRVNITVDQDLCPNRNTVSLTWDQPTWFQECISGYTLETTTAHGTQNTSVTSNTASESVGCCLSYNFTVTPVYTQNPAGQMITSNISLSFIPGQRSKSISI